jgi:hypothetical protein
MSEFEDGLVDSIQKKNISHSYKNVRTRNKTVSSKPSNSLSPLCVITLNVFLNTDKHQTEVNF